MERDDITRRDVSGDGGPAFPHAQRLWDNDVQSWAVHSVGGMTLRDYFAAQAMPALIAARATLDMDESDFSFEEAVANGLGEKVYGDFSWAEDLADDAYFIADAMLDRRKQ